MNLGVDREVVVPDRANEESAVEGDRSGVVRLVPQGARRRGRNRVRRVVPVVGVAVVGGQVVVPGHASGDVGPVVAVIRDIRVKPVLGVSRAISDGALVRVRGIIVGHSSHDAEVGVVGNNGGPVGSRVIEDSLADSAFRAIESNGVGAGSFKGGICPGR